MNLCLTCNKSIPIVRARDRDKRYCNRTCAGADRRCTKVAPCATCGNEFKVKLGRRETYCSNECRCIARRSTYTKQCEYCGSDFILNNRAYERRGAGKFCSTSCARREYSVDTTYFTKIDSQEKAYWLGFLYADGYQNGKEMRVNLSSKDMSHLELLKKHLRSDHPITKDENRSVSSLRIASNELCASLERWGCVQAKSLVIQFPTGLPENLTPHFIRGVFDGDGCVSYSGVEKKYLRISIHTGSKDFAHSLQDVFTANGIASRIYRQGRGFNVVIGKKDEVRRAFKWLYDNEEICLQRKRDIFLCRLNLTTCPDTQEQVHSE